MLIKRRKKGEEEEEGNIINPFQNICVRDVHQLKDACLVFWFLFTICVMPISTTTSWKWIVSMYLPISAFLWSLPSSNETCVLVLTCNCYVHLQWFFSYSQWIWTQVLVMQYGYVRVQLACMICQGGSYYGHRAFGNQMKFADSQFMWVEPRHHFCLSNQTLFLKLLLLQLLDKIQRLSNSLNQVIFCWVSYIEFLGFRSYVESRKSNNLNFVQFLQQNKIIMPKSYVHW